MTHRPISESITADVIRSFGVSEKRYGEGGFDFESVLDTWGQEYASVFAELGTQYPKDGALSNKYKALTPVFVINRIRAGAVIMQAHITRLKAGGTLAPTDCHEISTFDQQLKGELKKSPELAVEIKTAQEKIEEIRALFRASFGSC